MNFFNLAIAEIHLNCSMKLTNFMVALEECNTDIRYRAEGATAVTTPINAFNVCKTSSIEELLFSDFQPSLNLASGRNASTCLLTNLKVIRFS